MVAAEIAVASLEGMRAVAAPSNRDADEADWVSIFIRKPGMAGGLNRPERVQGEAIGRSPIAALFPGIEIAGG